MQEGFVTTSVGRVHYVRDGSGEPLFLMHGNGQSVFAWEEVLPSLSQNFDCIAWDMPGQGDSEVITRHLTIEDYADVAVEVLNGVGVTEANVLGSSVGGQICAALGAHHADSLMRLVFLETNYRPEAWWKENWINIERRFAIATSTLEQLKERFRAPDEKLLERWNFDRNKAGSRTMMSAMWAIREFDMATALKSVTTPSLLLFGEKGPAIHGREDFTASLPAAEVDTLAESGHFPPNDEPAEFVAALERYFKV